MIPSTGRRHTAASPWPTSASARESEAMASDPQSVLERLAEFLRRLEQRRPPPPRRSRALAVGARGVLDLADELQALGFVAAHAEPDLHRAEVLVAEDAMDLFLDRGSEPGIVAEDGILDDLDARAGTMTHAGESREPCPAA